MQSILQFCYKTSWKMILRVLPPAFKTVLLQIRLLQVAWILTSDWIKWWRSHIVYWSYVTCCKTSLPSASKMSKMYRFCRKNYNYSLLSAATFCNCNNLIYARQALRPRQVKVVSVTSDSRLPEAPTVMIRRGKFRCFDRWSLNMRSSRTWGFDCI